MSGQRILVAASDGIAAESWLKRKLGESIPESSVQVIVLGRNKHLLAALNELGIEATHIQTDTALRKSDVRKALSDCDHLLLFWDGRTLSDLLFEARLRGIPTKVHAIQVTEVVNRDRSDSFDAYIGRGTPWGNPFVVGGQEGQFDRDEAIEKYKAHFESNIVGDESKRRGLLGLRGMRIACHCKPLACHGDVIASYLNGLDPDHIEAA
ncbi:MAG: DUF4326 domain-containing protein [Rhodoferax sp.]|nr:DUF4326 domain-containing protein [Rhodoferax sp.]